MNVLKYHSKEPHKENQHKHLKFQQSLPDKNICLQSSLHWVLELFSNQIQHTLSTLKVWTFSQHSCKVRQQSWLNLIKVFQLIAAKQMGLQVSAEVNLEILISHLRHRKSKLICNLIVQAIQRIEVLLSAFIFSKNQYVSQ